MATQVETLRKAASDAWDAFSAEMAKFGDDNLPTEEQAVQIGELRKTATTAQKDMNAAENHLQDRTIWEQQEAQMRRSKSQPPHDEGGAHVRPQLASVGQRFATDPAYQNWFKAVAPNGLIPDSAKHLQSPPLHFKGMRELDMQAALITGTSDTSGGAFVTPTYYPGLTELGRRPLTIRQIITNLQTESDTVEYVRITTETNAAAPVVEATAASGGSGVKPESALAFERVTTAVKTIAHWIPATKRALSDASQIRGLIDAFLRYGLDEELEDQIANGDGVGENFTGILNTTGTQAQAWDTNVLTTTRKARRKVRTVGRRIPTAFILNPEDWEIIDLLADNEARYYFGGPLAMGTPRLWGLPVIESEAVPLGTGLVGDFAVCVLWDREQGSISVSDSHSDFFIRNLVAILAELRAAFGILKPNAIVEIDLTV
ncbi:MAG: phage major capsid protein [Chloroflexota bacterium]